MSENFCNILMLGVSVLYIFSYLSQFSIQFASRLKRKPTLTEGIGHPSPSPKVGLKSAKGCSQSQSQTEH